MAEQPSPRRRFQFRLRTLFGIFTVIAVILGTRMLMVRFIMIIGFPHSGTDEAVYNDASWWIAPLVIDASAIALGVWFVRRSGCTRS
jgi:hypothetical protein